MPGRETEAHMPHLNVHLLHPPEPEQLETLKENLSEHVGLTTGTELPERPSFHILVAGRPEREHLIASPNLQALIIPFAGLPDTTRRLLIDYPELGVHNLHHNAAATAEMAVALLLSAAKLILPYDRDLRKGKWTRRYQPDPTMLLRSRTALILGFGHIGQRIGQILQAFDMKVIGVRKNPEKSNPVHGVQVHPVTALHKLLPISDVLIVTLPLTPQTENLIAERELGALPEASVVINVGRGPVINAQALFQALKSGHLLAAGLDVWYRYPRDTGSRINTMPADPAFHELENVVLSPHRAGHSAGIERLRMLSLAELINKAANGQEMPNRVDVQAGY